MWVLLAISLSLILVVALLGYTVKQLSDDLVACRAHDHASCVANVGLMVSAAHTAEALETAAREYDSIEEQGRMKILAREHWRDEGPSMPVIWLLDRAAQIRQQEHTL